ncbi:MAG: glycerol kinase [Deltaproteobacteria bacterium]|nr:MAG: glycerol kinase [Deltaproteobacteria bacterium]
MSRYVMAIDQGTTGSTVMILSETLEVVGKGYSEFPQIYPKPGWVEHDPEEIWNSVVVSIQKALLNAKLDGSAISAIGITNQRETVLLWDRATGKPVHNAIVWQCRRTAPICSELKAAGLEPMYREKTGLLLDPYFSGTKARWLLEQNNAWKTEAAAGSLCLGTIDSFLVWRLSGGQAHVTDVSNASRTLMMDIHKLAWSDELLEPLGVPRAILPEIRGNAEVYGQTVATGPLPAGIPIAGMAGDQQAALFGQACFKVGQAKCTYGTGAFLLVNTGSEAVPSERGLLTTVGWKLGDSVTYALEGSVFIAGAAVQWLRDELKIIGASPEVESLAASVPDSGGVVFVPALAGLGAPHWNAEARGLIWGLTRGSNQGHIARATLEGVAFMTNDVLQAMSDDLGRPIVGLKVDGGASANKLLMQFQADLLQNRIVRPEMIETTALGAAFLGGLGAGIWSSTDDILGVWREDAHFDPGMSEEQRSEHLSRWKEAVSRA